MQTNSSGVLHHASLKADLHGLELAGDVWQFRGLQYASIPERFALPQPPTLLSGYVNCTSYGPRCPQNPLDFRHMLRIPPEQHVTARSEDEFACLNLDITLPAHNLVTNSAQRPFPVMVWVHGKSLPQTL
jgi:carboxylesterase type B